MNFMCCIIQICCEHEPHIAFKENLTQKSIRFLFSDTFIRYIYIRKTFEINIFLKSIFFNSLKQWFYIESIILPESTAWII